MMIIADAESDLILGASCIGHGAPELIATVSVAMEHGITAKKLGHTIYSHPTISEMVLEAVEDVHGSAIHKAGRRR
jgi:dihydrolipoamide dehydrogenase